MDINAIFASNWGPLLIFCCRIVDVSLDTMRVIFAIRGKRGTAAVLGFFMALVWIFAVGNAIKHLDSIWHILGYAAGYGAGTYVGISIERMLAFGVAMVRVVSQHAGVEIAEALRERGYGVTETPGFGREGTVEILQCVVQRSHLDEVLEMVQQWDSAAFITVEEPRLLRGGVLAARDWRVNGPWRKTRQRA